MKDELEHVHVPDEEAAQERAWASVRSAYAARERVTRRRSRWRLVPVPLAAAIATAVALTPAGAAVHRWIVQTLGVRHARASLTSLPAPGRVLVSGPGGAWTVSADGVRRRLGAWREASWSPRGIYVLLAQHDQLVAADPRGTPQWALSRPAIRFPRWFGPDGYRVAYLSGHSLRVIAGDGTGDHELAARVALIAPAWRTGHPYELAYASARGSVVVRDADTGRRVFSRRVPGIRLLAWTSDGSHLVVAGARGALVFDAHGSTTARVPTSGPVLDAALSPDATTLALLSDGEVTLTRVHARGAAPRRLFAEPGLRQLAFSPDGEWLLVTWPAANQWVFIRATGRPRLSADSRIAQQFGGRPPHVDGWCCGPG